jgi:hemolysin activation/secretion protein
VRGYDASTMNGDNGYILNTEYRTKPVIGCLDGKQTSFVALAFADIAQQDNWSAGGIHPDEEFFASVGAGVRYMIDPNLNVRLDYGLPLTSVRGDQRNQNGRLHIGATLMY